MAVTSMPTAVPTAAEGQEFGAFVAKEVEKWATMVRAAKVRQD